MVPACRTGIAPFKFSNSSRATWFETARCASSPWWSEFTSHVTTSSWGAHIVRVSKDGPRRHCRHTTLWISPLSPSLRAPAKQSMARHRARIEDGLLRRVRSSQRHRCRPCESRDPYSVSVVWETLFNDFRATAKGCGYGSRIALRLSGTTVVDFRFKFQTANYILAARGAQVVPTTTLEKRGRRECRVRAAPAVSRAKK